MAQLGNITLTPRDIGVPGVGLGTTITLIVNILLYVAGVTAVGFIIFGGMRYILSQGNQQAVEDAKNTILYAVVGLIITALAYALINYVISKV